MANTVTFRLEGDQAKAVQSFLKVVEAQNKAVSGMKRIKDEAGYAESAMSKFGGSMKSWAAGLVGLGTVTAAISGIGMEITRIGQGKSSFEDAMTPLLSLGDNIDRVDSLKASVLSLSAASGIGAEKIANLLYTAEGNASGLSKSIQDDLVKSTIILSKTTGTDLDVALKALTKTFRAYGDEVNDVATIMSKLAVVGDKGSATFQEMANFLPDILPATKALGVDMDTVFATIIAGTNQLGRTEKTFTGLRNVIVRMSKAVEQGLVPQGDFLSQLKAIATASPEEMIKAFGEEGFTVAAAMRSAADEVARLKEEIAGIRGDDLSGKLAKRMGDPGYAISEAVKSAQAIREKFDLTSGTGAFGVPLDEPEYAKLGFRGRMGFALPGEDTLAPTMAALNRFMPFTASLLSYDKNVEHGKKMYLGGLGTSNPSRVTSEMIRLGVDWRPPNLKETSAEFQSEMEIAQNFRRKKDRQAWNILYGVDQPKPEVDPYTKSGSDLAAEFARFRDELRANTQATMMNTKSSWVGGASGGAFKPVNAGDRG